MEKMLLLIYDSASPSKIIFISFSRRPTVTCDLWMWDLCLTAKEWVCHISLTTEISYKCIVFFPPFLWCRILLLMLPAQCRTLQLDHLLKVIILILKVLYTLHHQVALAIHLPLIMVPFMETAMVIDGYPCSRQVMRTIMRSEVISCLESFVFS